MKSNTSHTSGEWKIYKGHGVFEIFVEEKAGEIAQIFGSLDDSEAEANAKLIVNAPPTKQSLTEMLRIVEKYRAEGKLSYEEEKQFHEAIKNARL